ncbi:LemA family protein [Akkermansia muciniphila]|uniref:LemA family protein n=1 Tax=Akkermansia muciniphila TaxID=239935 RepID=UPI00122FA0CE|nr:LemA family protein [Akkermansia muciniphila]
MKKHKGLFITLGIVLVLIIGVVGWTVSSYNSLVNTQASVDQYKADIQADLQRRQDLVPNLVNTVKGYAAHEEEIFTQVAEARSKLAGATSLDDAAAADGELTQALGRLFAISEAYPELKASENFKDLQNQLEGTENRIAVSRKKYNEAAQNYNRSIKQFPKNIIASMFGFESVEYYEASDGAQNAPNVDFD